MKAVYEAMSLQTSCLLCLQTLENVAQRDLPKCGEKQVDELKRDMAKAGLVSLKPH